MSIVVQRVTDFQWVLLLIILQLFSSPSNAQGLDLAELLSAPLEYTILKTEEKINVDGEGNEKAWSKASWTHDFTDIEKGVSHKEIGRTRCKMLWDDNYLYVYAQLEEPHIWGSYREKDSPVYQDDAFEMFIDTDGDAHNYIELQINALGTVWDLFMPKPYRNGGRSLSTWDIKGLKKAVYINGTINESADEDKNWTIELAIPFNSIISGEKDYPSEGSVWRVQFARVDWSTEIREGKYIRNRSVETNRLLPEKYVVWSPVGAVNLHYPERWGYVLFSEKHQVSESFVSKKLEGYKTLLWKYYYLQQTLQKKTGRYANSIQELKDNFPDLVDLEEIAAKVKVSGSEHHFWIKIIDHLLDRSIFLDESGQLRVEEV